MNEITKATAILILAATLLLAGTSDRCSSLWEETNQQGIYYCLSEDSYKACSLLSSSKITCYLEKKASIKTGTSYLCGQKSCVVQN